jgi:hypothetical protein
MTEENLKEAQYFAGLLLTDAELDDVLELPAGTVTAHVSDPASPLGQAVRKGRLLTKCELHESILTTARRHSTPAQQMAADLLKRIELQ